MRRIKRQTDCEIADQWDRFRMARSLTSRYKEPMKYVMFYEMAPDGMPKAIAYFPAHSSRLKEFHQAGTLLMAGPYGNPPLGAIVIFTSRDAAEACVAGDPFVINGAVGKHSIHEWNEALMP